MRPDFPKRLPLVVALALVAPLALSSAGAFHHPSTACITTEAYHSYGPATFGKPMGGKVGRLGSAAVYDFCAFDINGDNIPFDYDGETEYGDVGGRFVAGSGWAGCTVAPEVSHHHYGVGATYWVWEHLHDVVYEAGADGPAFGDPCATDGIISANPMTDPADCGAGDYGYFSSTSSAWTPATLGETVNGNGACDPFDGYVWVFIARGPVTGTPYGSVVLSTPTEGHIWSA